MRTALAVVLIAALVTAAAYAGLERSLAEAFQAALNGAVAQQQGSSAAAESSDATTDDSGTIDQMKADLFDALAQTDADGASGGEQ